MHYTKMNLSGELSKSYSLSDAFWKLIRLWISCNPLTVVRGKKLRLVIDLGRLVNKYLQSCKFKYEGLPTLLEMFEKEFWFVTVDLELGYHHIDIDPQF